MRRFASTRSIGAFDRVGRLFNEQQLPLSFALNAQFPEQHPDLWKALRALIPDGPVIAHGLNNSTALLPLGRGLDAQAAYIRRTLDLIETYTGVRSRGWSSPSVYPNADTFAASAAAGIRYSLDSMDSDVLSRLKTPSGPLMLIPYPPVTVDMGQYLSRAKEPADLEHLWIDYVTELAREAEADPNREATVVAIGIHPFVVGTPSGAASLRRVLQNLKQQKLVWVTDSRQIAVGRRRETLSRFGAALFWSTGTPRRFSPSRRPARRPLAGFRAPVAGRCRASRPSRPVCRCRYGGSDRRASGRHCAAGL